MSGRHCVLVNSWDVRARHLVYGFATLLCIAAGPAIEALGPAGFLGYCALAVLHYLWASHRVFYSTSLLAFSAIGLVYALFSYLNALPDAWTVAYETEIIVRQAFFVPLVYPLIGAAVHFWTFILANGRPVRWMTALLIIGILSGPVSSHWYQDKALAVGQLLPGSLMNYKLAYLLGLTYLIYRLELRRRLVVLAPCVGLAVIMVPSLQANIVLLGGLALAVMPRWRAVLIVMLAGLSGGALASLFYIPELIELDVNSGWRAILWKTELEAVWQTGGLGVGFGKEAVPNGLDIGYLRSAFHKDFLLLGPHNSFIYLFYRLGVAGGLAFLVFFCWKCFPGKYRNAWVSRHACFVYFMCYVATFVNMSIESPRVLVGIALALGYILACNRVFADSSRAVVRERLTHSRMGENAYAG